METWGWRDALRSLCHAAFVDVDPGDPLQNKARSGPFDGGWLRPDWTEKDSALGGLNTGSKEMTKAELVEKLHNKWNGQITKKLATEMVDAVFENVEAAIKKDKRFSYPGFGTFVVRMRKARKGRNPQTGEVIKIKASKTVGFRAAKSMKDKL